MPAIPPPQHTPSQGQQHVRRCYVDLVATVIWFPLYPSTLRTLAGLHVLMDANIMDANILIVPHRRPVWEAMVRLAKHAVSFSLNRGVGL